MGRINAYLPDDLEGIMREKGLSASDLLQEALQARLSEDDRQGLITEWLADGLERHGPPSAEDQAWVHDVLAPLREREAEDQRAS
jgi:hypothetical protein